MKKYKHKYILIYNKIQMLLIGVLGRKRVGKDTTADYLVNKHKFGLKIAFATPLKDACKLLFNFTDEDVNDKKDIINHTWGVTPRTMLKYFGTDIFRNDIQNVLPNVEDKFWAKLCLEKCISSHKDRVVISDVRFQNEIDYIHKYNGIVIKLVNRNVPQDPDENQIDQLKGDYTIYNEQDYDYLYKCIDHTIDDILHIYRNE